MEYITKIQRNNFGDIINFETSTGRIISYRKAVIEALDGTIQGVETVEHEGVYYLQTENYHDADFSAYPQIQ